VPVAPKLPRGAPIGGLLADACQIPAWAFSFSRSLIDFAGPPDPAGALLADDPPSDIDQRSSKFALTAGFGVPAAGFGAPATGGEVTVRGGGDVGVSVVGVSAGWLENMGCIDGGGGEL